MRIFVNVFYRMQREWSDYGTAPRPVLIAGIYAASGAMVSGHTLKHLAAAAACYALLRYIAQRRPLAMAAAEAA